ncbi:MAG: reverse transcriptase/maturase family protein [Terrimicrobiaceae bacterium]|nr:reverse transcriptase/maturase family protein [Terrimicrobiaceae bacterium]
MNKKLNLNYYDIVSPDNLLLAWQEFIVGKKSKNDVIEFSLNLSDNILQLHGQLANLSYQHGGYQDFYISDPKLRHIHKASVRDRLIHHAIYRQLYPFFSKTFIAHSYSCQLGKGTHRALGDFRKMTNKVSQNDTKTCWVLQCDIRKFFDSIDHQVLLEILKDYIEDEKIIRILTNIISSFQGGQGKGLPLGNLTSQLFINIYMNVFDQHVKHRLKAEYYIRYADDFVIMSGDKEWLISTLVKIDNFLSVKLKLQLHPQKVHLKTLASGVDFLGWIHFPKHRVLRNKTKRRMMKKIKNSAKPESLASYLGLLKHGNSYDIRQELLNNYWINSLQ